LGEKAVRNYEKIFEMRIQEETAKEEYSRIGRRVRKAKEKTGAENE